MISLSLTDLFSPRFDNAQRVSEKGYGLRLEPYDFTDEQLLAAVDKMLADEEMRAKYRRMAARMAASNSKLAAVQAMEKLVEDFSASEGKK